MVSCFLSPGKHHPMELMVWLYLLQLRGFLDLWPPEILISGAGPLASEFSLGLTARCSIFPVLLPIESQKSDSLSLFHHLYLLQSKLQVFLLSVSSSLNHKSHAISLANGYPVYPTGVVSSICFLILCSMSWLTISISSHSG